MKLQPRRRFGILLVAVSVVFLIAAVYTLFFYVDERKYGENPPVALIELIDELKANDYIKGGEAYSDDPFRIPNTGPAFPHWYKWPYRWLSKPLAIIGISLLLTGLLLGYHDDISQIF